MCPSTVPAGLRTVEGSSVPVLDPTYSSAFWVRVPGKRGDAHVSTIDRAIYDARFGVRAEGGSEQLKIHGLGFGLAVRDQIRFVKGNAGPAYENNYKHTAPSMETQLKTGFRPRSSP